MLVGTAGHLHPGGLWTDLTLTRDGQDGAAVPLEGEVLRAGRRRVVGRGDDGDAGRAGASASRKGDVLSVSATYDTRRSSWYESMGIMITRVQPGRHRPGPVRDERRRARQGHARPPAREPQPRRRLRRPARRAAPALRPAAAARAPCRSAASSTASGDLGMHRPQGPPADDPPGQTLRFVNRDAKRNIFHTITSCKAPCNGATGIAYPLANGPVRFDSGNLGFGPEGRTAAAQRITWRTPKTIRPGHLHVLLPRAPVHARRVPRRSQARLARASFSADGEPVGRPGAAQGDPDVAVVAPGGAGRDEDPLGRPGRRRAPCRAARRVESHSSGPVPGGKARSVPASTAARCSRSAAASSRRRGR